MLTVLMAITAPHIILAFQPTARKIHPLIVPPGSHYFHSAVQPIQKPKHILHQCRLNIGSRTLSLSLLTLT
ncbi:hypothetical protein M758_10G153600 [Ceratodon purpureus]|nr:hypothetical protein M758_10G153600 [Ceratodon purpureus]